MHDDPPSKQDRTRRAAEALREASTPRIRVLIADDHGVIRQALRLLLQAYDEVEVIADVGDGREAVELAAKLTPDVVLMDVAMPNLNGVDAARQICQRVKGCKVLMLTGMIDDERLFEALRAGASGYVVKRSDVRELLLAIQAVHAGNPFISSVVAEGRTPLDLIIEARSGEGSPLDRLTPREREILQLVAEGHANQSIADTLVVSVKTVEAHKAHIMEKLGMAKTTDLIRYALRRGIISLETGPAGAAHP